MPFSNARRTLPRVTTATITLGNLVHSGIKVLKFAPSVKTASPSGIRKATLWLSQYISLSSGSEKPPSGSYDAENKAFRTAENIDFF